MIYLDNSATTQPKKEVIETFVEVNERFYGNPASIHQFGRTADALLHKTREQLLQLVNNPFGQVIYTSGGTESNNLAVLGYARKYQYRGKHIISTEIEHPSVLNALKQLEDEGFTIDYLSVDSTGTISLQELSKKVKQETILVSIMHVNNEIGSIQPIVESAKIIRQQSRAIFHVDAVQSFGKLPITLMDNGPDAITISSHKIHGLKGSGALIVKENQIPAPITFGGGQEETLRSGTVAVANAAALAKAARLMVQSPKNENYTKWKNVLLEHVEQFEEVLVIAPESSAPHILALAFKGIRGEVAVNFFQQHQIMISTSSACVSKSGDVSHVVQAIKLPRPYKDGVIRISFGEMNTDEEIEKVQAVLTKFINVLRRGTKHVE